MLICLYQWSKDGEDLMLAMAGAYAGLAITTKYTNGIILIAGATAILMLHRPTSWKKSLFEITWFGGTATLVMLPWLLKNILATSNPFYPLFFPSGAMDEILLDFYQFKPSTQDWSRLLLLPWQATIMGVDGGN